MTNELREITNPTNDWVECRVCGWETDAIDGICNDCAGELMEAAGSRDWQRVRRDFVESQQ